MKTRNFKFTAIAIFFILASCAEKKEKNKEEPVAVVEMEKEPIYDANNPQSILTAVEYAHGGWDNLWNKKDVEYTYTYHNTVTDKNDISVEKYIFDSEASFGHYTTHEINVMPGVEGEVTQFFNGKETKVMVDGTMNSDPQANAGGDFLRKANYFWFVMPYKLNDKGTIATSEGQEELNGKTYDKLKITYDSAITGKEQNDTYVLYVNPETKLIDRFYFSLPFMGVTEPVIIADYEYADVDGHMVATKRSYYMPSENGYAENPNLVQTLTNIKFNNGFTTANLIASVE